MTETPRIAWCDDPLRTHEIAEFFARNVISDTSYISHSELQGPRALSTTQWRQPLAPVLEEEIGPRLAETQRETEPGRDSKPTYAPSRKPGKARD